LLALVCFSYFSSLRWWSSLLHLVGITDPHHNTWFISWDGVFLIFCPSWPWAVILPIPASQVAGITDVNHCAKPLTGFKTYLVYSVLCIANTGKGFLLERHQYLGFLYLHN
jgi:hypothetical protein